MLGREETGAGVGGRGETLDRGPQERFGDLISLHHTHELLRASLGPRDRPDGPQAPGVRLLLVDRHGPEELNRVLAIEKAEGRDHRQRLLPIAEGGGDTLLLAKGQHLLESSNAGFSFGVGLRHL